MSKTILQNGGGITNRGTSVTRWYAIGASSSISAGGLESVRANTFRTAGVLSNLLMNLINNGITATTSWRVRKSTSNGNGTLSIPSSTTGKFEDLVNTDVVAAGDDFHYQLVTGATGTSLDFATWSILFYSKTNTVVRYTGGSDSSYTSASSTIVFSLGGGLTNSPGGADSAVGITFRTAGTFRNLYININSNARVNTTTFVSRVNSISGAQTISIGSGVTGILEDTTHTDTINSGDLVNFALVTGTGTQAIAVGVMAAEFETTNNSTIYSCLSSSTTTAGTTVYYSTMGSLDSDTTESHCQIESNVEFTSSLLQCNVTANTIVLASTLNLRKNGASANQTVSITATTTGIFQDTTNTDSIGINDTINYQLIAPSTVTSITLASISMLGKNTIYTQLERMPIRGVIRGIYKT